MEPFPHNSIHPRYLLGIEGLMEGLLSTSASITKWECRAGAKVELS